MAILRAGKFFRFSLMTAVFLRILGKMPCARRARKGETAMSAKSTAPDLAGYRAWLQARECSAGTVEKYLRDVARFFAEAEAQSPAPKEAVAGWRDALAAVNAYQTFSGNPQGRARPLKCQRRVFCEARRELCSRLARWCRRRGVQADPVFTGRGGQPLGRITVWKMLKALCEPAGVEKDKAFPHNLRHLFARTFYGVEKKSLEAGGPARPLQRRDDAHLYYGIGRRAPEAARAHAPAAVKQRKCAFVAGHTPDT